MLVRVFLNGEKFNGTPCEADFTIACDGGYKYCLEKGICVDKIIGDFDSLGFVPNGADKYSRVKDFTDGEASVELVKNIASEIVFYNFGGGREDHFFGNLALLVKAKKYNIKAKAVTNYCEIYYVEEGIKLEKVKGKTITIVPFGDSAHILKGTGLYYPIKNLIFTSDKTLGVSNEAVEDEVELKLRSGKVFVFVVKENV